MNYDLPYKILTLLRAETIELLLFCLAQSTAWWWWCREFVFDIGFKVISILDGGPEKV